MIVGIIDCSIKTPSHACYNRLVSELSPYRFTYHHVSLYGMSSLLHKQQEQAYFLFGSASNVEDQFDWHRHINDFLMEKLLQHIPVLGICFGHQLMCHSFGATIDWNDKQRTKHTGRRIITIEKNYGPYLQGQTFSIAVSHAQEVKTLSNDLICIASTDAVKFEMVGHKKLPLVCIQGHPESSDDFLSRLAQVNDPKQRQETLHDGLALIKQFLDYYRL